MFAGRRIFMHRDADVALAWMRWGPDPTSSSRYVERRRQVLEYYACGAGFGDVVG